jgi:hypothetical protein
MISLGLRSGLTAQNDYFGTRSNNNRSNAYFGFGDTSGSNTALQQYNRVLAFSTNTETSNTNFTTGGKIPQNFGCFSNYTQRMYIFSGYVNPGLDSNTNYSSITSNTQGTISSAWAGVTRRGGCGPASYFGIRGDTNYAQIWFGGYSDNTGLYYSRLDALLTVTETGSAQGSNSYTCHVGAGFANYLNAYFVGGINNGVNISTISKRNWSTGIVSTVSATDNATGYYTYGISNWGYGYRFGGVGNTNYANTLRFNFYNETSQTGTALPSTETQFAGVTSASNVFGYLWTGYRSSTLNRFLNLYSWSTSTISNNSYTTTDASNGWINATGGV